MPQASQPKAEGESEMWRGRRRARGGCRPHRASRRSGAKSGSEG